MCVSTRVRSQLTKYIAIVVPFGTAVCLAYLYGYWQPLGVNVLEFIALSDVVRLSLFPMMAALLGIIFAVLTGGVSTKILPPGGGRDTPIGRALRRNWGWLALFWAANVIVVLVVGAEPWKWFALAMLISLLSTPLANTDAAMEAIPNDAVRSIVLFVILWCPGLAFANGRIDADYLKTGRAQNVIEASRLPLALQLRSTAQKPIMYAGRLGDRLAFYETLSKQLILVREDEVPVLPIREK